MNWLRNIAEILKVQIIKKPVLFIILSIITAGILIPPVVNMKADFSYRIWFDEEDPLLKRFDAFERQFGNDESVAVMVYKKGGIFNKDSIEKIRNLTDQLWYVPKVIRVDSLTNHNYTQAVKDELMVDPFIPDDVELSQEFLDAKKNIAINDETMPMYLISQDAEAAMLYARMKPELEGKFPNYKSSVDKIREIVAEIFKDDEHKVFVSGSSTINVTFEEVSRSDLKTMIPVLISLIIIFLIVIFRGISGVVYPFVIIILSIGAAFGIGSLSHMTFNVMLSAIPNTLIAICIADIVHILMSYMQYRRLGHDNKESVKRTLDKNLVPTLLTSLSTAIGFFSLAPAKIIPIANMGVLAGAGTLTAWIFTIFFILPLMVLFPAKSKNYDAKHIHKNNNGKEVPFSWALKFTLWLQLKRNSIIMVSIITVIASFYLGLQNEVNSDPYKYFTDNVPMKHANDFLEAELGGSMGAQMVIDSKKADGIKDPVFLQNLEKFVKYLESKKYVTRVVSVLDILKSMNRSLNGGRQEEYRIADTKDIVAQELFLYTMSLPQGMDLNNRVTLNNDATRLTIMMNIHDSKTVLEEFDKWENKLKEFNLEGNVTGKIPLYQKMNGYVVNTFFTSISMALILVSILMILVFGSWKIGLLAMIPNTVPLIIGSALMYLLGKPLDMGTVIITSVCLGIAVDDTIHFIANYRKYIKNGYSPVDAVANVFSYTGPALVLTTVILVVGFGTFMFADFLPNVNFGIMTATILSTALIVDLTLLPALLLPKKVESKNN